MISFTRIWLPAIVTLAGVLVMAIGRDEDALEGGAAIVGAGLSIYLINVLWRIGFTGDRERDEEDAARRFLDEHGYWPDEAPPAERPPPAASTRSEDEPRRARHVDVTSERRLGSRPRRRG